MIAVIGSLTMASTASSQAPQKVNGTASTSDALNIPPIAREILENYSGVAPDEVAPHVVQIVRHIPSWFQLSLLCFSIAVTTPSNGVQ